MCSILDGTASHTIEIRCIKSNSLASPSSDQLPAFLYISSKDQEAEDVGRILAVQLFDGVEDYTKTQINKQHLRLKNEAITMLVSSFDPNQRASIIFDL